MAHVVTVVAIHIATLTAPSTYSPTNLTAFILSSFFTLQFGLTLGYHRLLAHRSYQTYPVIRRAFALLGCLAGQAGPISWAGIHRFHHSNADSERDPHSPNQGFAWAHLFWALHVQPIVDDEAAIHRLTQDLCADEFLCFLERRRIMINIGFIATVFVLGAISGGWYTGIGVVIWTVVLRVVLLWHLTFLVNSAAHMWGYRNYPTPDRSRNLWWVAILLLGDGWHNNHHADPRAAAHGRRWFELDVTFVTLRVMERLGLAWDLRPVTKPVRQNR